MSFNKQLNAWTKEDLEKAAEEEFGETPALLESSRAAIESWLEKCPHLDCIKKDDKYREGLVTTFLRGCKFSLERTKEKIDNLHAVKTNCLEWFDNWDPLDPKIQQILNSGICLPIPGYDKQGRAVILNRSGKINPSKIKFDDLLRAIMMINAVARKDDNQAIILGFAMVQDMAGLGADHITLFNLASIKKLITMGQKAFPDRPKMMHVLNRPAIVESFSNMVRGLQKEKQRSRQVIHPPGEVNQLVQDLGQEVLPKEYGGTNGTVEELTIYWKEQLEIHRDWLLCQSSYKSEEQKRPGKPKLHADLFGIEGSFRKLEID